MKDGIDSFAKYVIATVIVIGCFILIYQGRGGDVTLPWAQIALVTGWLIRDSAGNSATANLVRAAQSQPTITATGGPPASVTSTPAKDVQLDG
jgi:hypothetical protein